MELLYSQAVWGVYRTGRRHRRVMHAVSAMLVKRLIKRSVFEGTPLTGAHIAEAARGAAFGSYVERRAPRCALNGAPIRRL